MFDKKLIECVRKNPILYDLSHPEYMDTELKSDVWKKIGAELKVEGGTCKTRWNGIRDSYRKFLKKTVARSAQGGKPFPAYKYAKQMRFLQKFYDDKGSESLYQYCSTSFADDQISDTEEKQLNDTIIVDNSTADENVLTEEILVNESTKEEQVPTPTKLRKKNSSLCEILPKPCVEVSKELINTNSNNEERASTKVMDVCHKDTESSKPVVEHPVDVFLNAMAPSLKTLSPLNWHLAKSEIFSIVQKYELRTLTGQGQVQLQVIKLHNSATPSPSTLPLLKPKDTSTGGTGK